MNNKQNKALKEDLQVFYLHTVRDNIESALGANNEDIRENLRNSLGAGVDLSIGSAAAIFVNATEDRMDGVKLKARFDAINATIEAYVRDNIVPLFEGNEEEGIVGYNDLYALHERLYNNLTPKYKKEADKLANGGEEEGSEGKGLFDRVDQPTANTYPVLKCPGKCNGYYKTVDEFCKPKLSLSFNDTNFGTGDELVVKVKIKDFYLANMYISGGFRTGSYANPKDPTKTEMRTTFTLDDTGYSEVKINVWYTRKDGSLGLIEESQYINVEKVGYFDNGDSFSAYESYEAEVFSVSRIDYVKWYIKGPLAQLHRLDRTEEMEGDSKSASWSYSLDSTSFPGTYKVYVRVRYKTPWHNGESESIYTDTFTVQ